MANANSSLSKKPIVRKKKIEWQKYFNICIFFEFQCKQIIWLLLPSALQSANFHILLSTEFGSLDLINSVFAAIRSETQTHKKIGLN